MKPNLREILVCPHCRNSLRLSGPDEELICDCGARYPIVNSIPRILKEYDAKTQKSFSYEWRNYRYRDEQREWDLTTFLKGVGQEKEFFKDKRVLEVGCGRGVHTRSLPDFCREVISIDLSYAIDLVPPRDNLQLIQTDIMNLPFREESFDLVFSFGVLHHTPDARRAFSLIAPLVKRGGKLVISLYPKLKPFFESVNRLARSLSTRLPHRVLDIGCHFLVPFVSLGYALAGAERGPYRRPIHSWWERHWLLFDWFSSPYQSHHSKEEVFEWFREEGFTNIREFEVRNCIGGVRK